MLTVSRMYNNNGSDTKWFFVANVGGFKVAVVYWMSSPSRNETNLFRSGQLLITS